MYAVYYEKQKFLTRERMETVLKSKEKEDEEYPQFSPYNRIALWDELTIITVNYIEVQPYNLDSWFKAQMNSVDNAMATGSAKRSSRNGYDPSLCGEEDEEY